MTKEEALKYCYEHINEYIDDVGTLEFYYLIEMLQSDMIKPDKIKFFGMDY